jgi:predicted transcriptional regulator
MWCIASFNERRMTMPVSSSVTLSLRVPNELKIRLEQASVRTHRSRAYLTIAALKKYLNDVEKDELKTTTPSKYELAERYRGIGAKMLGKGRTAIEIDAIIREIRGDE